MIWKRKIKKSKKGNLTFLENEILNYLIKQLPKKYGELIKQQLKYLQFLKRIEYNNDVITELYPKKFGTIPEEILFERKEEFLLAVIKFNINDKKYTSDIHMVLGQLFDIKISPKPIFQEKDIDIDFFDIKIEEILNKNIY